MSPRTLTVVQLLPALESGGVERGTLEVAGEIVRRGYRSVVISAGGRLVGPLESAGSRHITWNIGRKSPLTLRHVAPLRRLLRELDADVLHPRSRVPAWVAWLAWRGMDVATRPRLLTTVHGLYSPGLNSSVMTRGQRVIAISRTVERYIHRHFPKCPPERIHVIPRGVAPEAFPTGLKPTPAWWDAWHARFPETRGKRLLALAGRITRLKGHSDFIRMLAHLQPGRPEVHGLIVGAEDPRRLAYARELRQLASSLGLTGLSFTGERADMPEVLAACDIVYALSADPPEAFGRTALEALALGRPVIGYDAGGTGEVLGELLPQGLVKPGDLAALDERTRAFLDAPPTPAPNQRYTLRRMLDDELALCEELAAERRR